MYSTTPQSCIFIILTVNIVNSLFTLRLSLSPNWATGILLQFDIHGNTKKNQLCRFRGCFNVLCASESLRFILPPYLECQFFPMVLREILTLLCLWEKSAFSDPWVKAPKCLKVQKHHPGEASDLQFCSSPLEGSGALCLDTSSGFKERGQNSVVSFLSILMELPAFV